MLVFQAYMSAQLPSDDANTRIFTVESSPLYGNIVKAPNQRVSLMTPEQTNPQQPKSLLRPPPKKEQQVSNAFLPPPTPKPSTKKLTKAEKEQKRYDEALAKGVAKKARNRKDWTADPTQNECYLNSSFVCEPMLNYEEKRILELFSGACAPSFIIPGTAKSGTTSLYFYLIEHPQVLQALSGQFDKEVRFFTEKWKMGTKWYMQQFPPVTPRDFPDKLIHMISGEASPTYFYDFQAPIRIKATIPNVKLIIVLRDPVERAYSDKMQLIANKVKYKADPFEDMRYQIQVFNACFENGTRQNTTIEAFYNCYNEPKFAHKVIRSHPYVMDSVYVYQVQHWLRYFNRSQILFVKGEDMYTNAVRVMDQVTDFLGLCPFDWSPFVSTVHNRRAKGYDPMPPAVRQLLTNFYRPFTNELYSTLNYAFTWDEVSV